MLTELPFEALLFDLDGTLVDSAAVVVGTWRWWAVRHGLELSRILAVSHGRPTIETMREVALHLATDDEAREFLEREVEDIEGLKPVPGAFELLRSLTPDRWGVVTSCSRNLAEVRLRACGLPVPDVLVTADQVTYGKPHPEPYLAGAGRLGRAPADCVAFEDAPAGIASARAAGMTVIGLATTLSAAELDCELCVRDLRAVSVDGYNGRLALRIEV